MENAASLGIDPNETNLGGLSPFILACFAFLAFCNFEQGCTEWSPMNGFVLYGTAATGWPAWCENSEEDDDANADMKVKING